MEKLVKLFAYGDWLIGVTQRTESQFFCWVITPEAIALNDGEVYSSALEAMKSGRILVFLSVE
ncbi:MAG: hypothetical protein AAGA92_13785 [Planctomycetota bacterium]